MNGWCGNLRLSRQEDPIYFLFICLCDEIGRIDERDERDLLTEGEDGGGYAVTGPIF